jgi:hypothetical protein
VEVVGATVVVAAPSADVVSVVTTAHAPSTCACTCTSPMIGTSSVLCQPIVSTEPPPATTCTGAADSVSADSSRVSAMTATSADTCGAIWSLPG